MRPERTRRSFAVLLVTGLVLAGCSGGSGSSGGDANTAAAGTCSPRAGTVTLTGRALADDRGVLPADNFVAVVSSKGDFRAGLDVLDLATRGLSSEDVAALLGASRKAEPKVLKLAVSDVVGKGRGSYRLVVADTDLGAAVGRFYEAALMTLGASATVTTVAGADQAVARVSNGSADGAVLGLVDLAAAVDAKLPDGGDPSAQVQAIATASSRQHLALGATANASRQVQVLVPGDQADDKADDSAPTTLSELAKTCPGARIAAGEGTTAAARTLAEAYGFELDDATVTDPLAALDGTDVAVIVDPLRYLPG